MTGALWLLASSGAAAEGGEKLPGGHDATFRPHRAEGPPPAPSRENSASVLQYLPRLSSGFGWRLDPIRGARALHTGIDIPGPLGSPILAAGGGVVHFAGGARGYGNLIEVDHGGGLVTRYAHLSRFLVSSGARVERGQMIAMMGSTGRSTGSHLHFEVRLNGQATGPLGWLTREPAPMRVSPQPIEPHISAFARARAETESVVGAAL
ncbi:MAG: M23 family metallopeptidase [Sphingomonas sp.]